MAKRKRSSSTSNRIQIKSNNNISDYCCDCKSWGWLFLILGIIYVFSDLGWVNWWNIQWYSILFLLLGLKWIKK